MDIKEHRIYQYMSEPFRLMGLTVDELSIFIIGFFLFFIVESVFFKILCLLINTLGIYLLKKFKKLATGFSLKSYLHWTFGLRFGLTKSWPESWKRMWLP